VHSYDFSWHAGDDPQHASAAVTAFRGITGVDNIAFEFDGPKIDQSYQFRIAEAALSQGAGLKAANYSYEQRLPSSWPVLVEFGKLAARPPPKIQPPAREQTVLLFLSKWANYSYRERDEWLHDAQFGAWFMLSSRHLPVRIICEDNVDEDLSRYRGVYVAFSPPELLPRSRRERLAALFEKMPAVVELSAAPEQRPTTRPVGHAAVDADRWITLNYPLAYHWFRGDRAACKDLLDVCVRFLSEGRR
jgi:hypothetical protein